MSIVTVPISPLLGGRYLAKRALLAARVKPAVVSGLSPEKIDGLVAAAASRVSEKARPDEFIRIIGPGSVTYNQARAAAAKLSEIAPLLSGNHSDRPVKAFADDRVLAQTPAEIVAHAGRVLTSDYSHLVQGLDFHTIDGRSLLLNVEPFPMFGRSIGEVKFKGVKFTGGTELQPYLALAPVLDEIDAEGKVAGSRQIDYKPTDAMEAPLAAREFKLMNKAFRRGVDVVMPLLYSVFPSTSYNGSPLGSVVHLRERGLKDLRTHFSEMIGFWQIRDNAFCIAFDPAKAARNLTLIDDFWRNLGRTYRQLHDAGVLHRIPHPGNIPVLPDGKLRLSDFEFGLDLDGMTWPQKLMYRANELRQIFLSFVFHLNPRLLFDIDRLGIKIAQRTLEGYFWDKPTAKYAISLTGSDRINEMLASVHRGEDASQHPLIANMRAVIGGGA